LQLLNYNVIDPLLIDDREKLRRLLAYRRSHRDRPLMILSFLSGSANKLNSSLSFWPRS